MRQFNYLLLIWLSCLLIFYSFIYGKFGNSVRSNEFEVYIRAELKMKR